MDSVGPYQPPAAELVVRQPVATTPSERKLLVPLWIKVFGWFFITGGPAVIIGAIAFPLLGIQPAYEMHGVSFVGSPFHPTALLMSSIIILEAIAAYGLLFGRTWGLKACFVMGYLGLTLDVASTLYSIFVVGDFSIQLGIPVYILYLMRLHKISPRWK
jgi:hypothetical protein